MEWLRLYVDLLDDRRLQRDVPAETFRDYINILCVTRKHGGTLPSIEDIAYDLRKSEAETARILSDLRRWKLLDDTAAGTQPHNWDRRQYASDTSTPRVQKHRAKQRETAPLNEGGNVPGNVSWNVPVAPDETDQNQRQNQRQNQTLNPEVVLTETSATGVAVTPTDAPPVATVAPTKTIAVPKPPAYSDRFERAFWDRYPACSRRRDKVGAYQAWKKAGLDAAPADEVQAVTDSLAAWSVSHEWQKEAGAYIPLPASFLNGRQWEAPAPEPAGTARASPNGHRPSGVDMTRESARRIEQIVQEVQHGEHSGNGAGPIGALLGLATPQQRPGGQRPPVYGVPPGAR